MQVGVFAKTFPGTRPDTVFAACKAAGFESVQYNMSCSGLDALPAHISRETADHVASMSTAAGLEIAAVSATYNMIHPDMDRRKVGRHAFETIAENAARMGTNLLTVCTGSMDPEDQWCCHPANDHPTAWSTMSREFEIILDHADRHNVMIGVEPEHANVVSSARKAQRLLKQFSGSQIRIVLDPANILEDVPADRQEFTIDEALDLLGSKIVLAHAKDRTADGQVAPTGEGIVNWQHFLQGLSRVGFCGPLIAHGMSAEQAPAVAKYLNHQLAMLESDGA